MGVKYTSGSTTYRPVEWVTGDTIAISGASANYKAGTLTNNNRTATFTGSGAQMEGGLYKAYYPATIYNKTSKKTSFPATQTYGGLSGSKTIIGDLPMYAASSTTSLTFRNLCAVLNFRLKGESTQKVTEIVVTSSNQNLWGEFTIGGTPESPTVTMNTATGGRAVTLNCGAGVALSPTDEKEFFIAIPAQTYLAGTLTIQIKDGTTTLATLTNSSATDAQTTFSRNQIYEIGKDTQPPGNFVFTVTDPTDLAYTAGTSTTGRVVSYKETGTTRTPVAWTVEGYYPTEADAQNQTNAYTNITATNFLNSFNPASQTGSTSGEAVSIGYRAATSTTTTESPYNMAMTRLTSNAGAYVQRGTASNPWNLANPQTGSRDYIEETANTYIVNAPGYYCIPLVYGNAIKNGTKNTSAYTRSSYFTNSNGATISSPFMRQGENGATASPSTAIVSWEEAEIIEVAPGSWNLPSGCITSSNVTIDGTSQTVYWLNFHVKEAAPAIANIIVQGGQTWSWTIWMTDYVPCNYPTYNASSDVADIECTYNNDGQKLMFMPVNLGWSDNSGSSTSGTKYTGSSVFVRVKQSGSNNIAVMKVVRPEGFVATGERRGHNPFFQWGRKDPMFPSRGVLESSMSPWGYTSVFSPLYGANAAHNYCFSGAVTMAQSIASPSCFWTSNISGGANWCSNSGYIWWGGNNYATSGVGSALPNWDRAVVKTIYDPCPAGYTVPRQRAFYFTGIGSGSSPNASGSFNNGYHIWTGWRALGDPTAGMKTIYFPAAGIWYSLGVYGTTVQGVESLGMYWTAALVQNSSPATACCFQFTSTGTNVYQKWSLDNGANIRPAREE